MFVYNSVQEKTSNSTPWFKDVNPAAYESILETVRNAPGFVSGNWEVDPSNPNRFLITHSWNDKASWKNMSNSLKSLSAMQMGELYRKNNEITTTVNLSE